MNRHQLELVYQHLQSVVSRAVVHHYYFQIWVGNGQQSPDAFRDVGGFLKGGNENSDMRGDLGAQHPGEILPPGGEQVLSHLGASGQ